MTRLDELMPEWQFRERHSIRIDTKPEAIFEAIRSVRAEDILFFRTMVAMWVSAGVFAAINFLTEPNGILSTETRVHAKTASARRLRAIRRRAEQR